MFSSSYRQIKHAIYNTFISSLMSISLIVCLDMYNYVSFPPEGETLYSSCPSFTNSSYILNGNTSNIVFFLIIHKMIHIHHYHHQCGGMVSMLASTAVDHGFELRSGQIKDYKTDIYCFSAKHAAIRRKSKTGWLGIGIMWGNMSTHGLLFHWASTIKIKLSVLV